MSGITLTHEQEDILDAAAHTRANLLVQALAGAAKTTTLVKVAERMRSTPMLFLAFNKKIAVELEKRLPSTCHAQTLNSLGHRAWGDRLGKRLDIDPRKMYKLTREYIDHAPKSDKDALWEDIDLINWGVRMAKQWGWVPDSERHRVKSLITDEEFYERLYEEPSPEAYACIFWVVCESFRLAQLGKCDFDDQILMPTVCTCSFPEYPIVLVDEAQDLSELNHAMLKKVARKRLIAVGDECQAIYGFRGAHSDSMEVLGELFDMHELPLTMSFRCPASVVEEARWRAPAMNWPDWAEVGEVRKLEKWGVGDLPDDAAVICRNNAPLFSLGLKLLSVGRAPNLSGNELSKTMLRTLRKFGASDMPTSAVFEQIKVWQKRKHNKTRSPRSVDDTAECMRAFAYKGKTLGEIVAYAERLFDSAGPINLMTGHKAKGLEFDEVFFLDEHLIRDTEQDPNIKYVIQTRAKKRLTYVDSDGFSFGGFC